MNNNISEREMFMLMMEKAEAKVSKKPTYKVLERFGKDN